MAILGNRPPALQNQGMNATNMSRARGVNIPGLTPGQLVSGNQLPQGYALNVPRDWSQGGARTYDPNYATQLSTPQAYGQKGNGPVPQTMQGNAKPGNPTGSSYSGFRSGFGGDFGQTGSMGGLANISTSIQPKAIYDPWMTDVAVERRKAMREQT